MFDRLTSGLSSALKSLSGRGWLSEDNITDTVREVRLALLDADVALSVVKTFTEAVKARAIGVEVTKSLTPGQAFIKVVHEELIRLMGEPSAGLNLRAQRPVVVMLAGLQGAGKTTTAGKLARWLIEKQKKKVLMVSTDVYRPAAILQLRDPGLAGGRGIRRGDIERSARGDREARADRGDAAGLRRAAARHGGPPARRCRDDGRRSRNSRRPSIPTSGCSSSTAWPGRTRSTPPRPSTTP